MEIRKKTEHETEDIKLIYIPKKGELSEVNQEFDFKQFSEFTARIEQVFKSFNQIKQSLSGLANRFQQASLAAKSASKKIVNNGWFISPNSRLDFSQIIALQDLSHEELNVFFRQYYEEDDGVNLKMIFENLNMHLKNSSIDNRLKKLLSECIDTYEKEFYIVSTISLFVVVEGLIYNLFYNVTSDKLEKNNAFKSMKKKIKEKDSILEFAYLSVFDYLKKSFEYAEFSKEEPGILNRNWLLHGKSEYEITQLDAIKMFSLIDSILEFH